MSAAGPVGQSRLEGEPPALAQERQRDPVTRRAAPQLGEQILDGAHPPRPQLEDDVTRLILDTHDTKAFARVAAMTVGEFRDFLLSDRATTEVLERLAPAVADARLAAAHDLERVQSALSANAILKKRDWAFCLYPPDTLHSLFDRFVEKVPFVPDTFFR